MGRLHMRNGTLILKDGTGRSLEIRVLDWTLEYGSSATHAEPVITVQVAPPDPEDQEGTLKWRAS